MLVTVVIISHMSIGDISMQVDATNMAKIEIYMINQMYEK